MYSGHSTKKNRTLRFITFLLVASSFGPYVVSSPPVRLDNVVVYSLFAVLGLHRMLQGRLFAMNRDLARIILVWAALTGFLALITYMGDFPDSIPGGILSDTENYMTPVAILCIMGWATDFHDRNQLLDCLALFSGTVMIFMSINAFLAAACVYWDANYVNQVLSHFSVVREGQGDLMSAYDRTAVMSRYCGIFELPGESAVSYSIAVFAWVYCASKESRLPLSRWLMLGCLTLGGILSASRIFLVLALPLSIVLAWETRLIKRMISWKAIAFIVCMIMLRGVLAESWTGWDMLLERWFGSSSVSLYDGWFGNRYGGDGGIMSAYSMVSQESPLYGFGWGVFGGMDNAWLNHFCQGGWLGVILYCFWLALIGYVALAKVGRSSREGYLLVTLWIFIVLGGLASSFVLMNRASQLLLVLLSLSVVSSSAPILVSYNAPQRRSTSSTYRFSSLRRSEERV